MGYIGTNFDLVDGVKAKNLFFATNILVRPIRDNIGFYISLYGNRTISTIDSIPNVERRFVFDSINNLYSAIEKSDLLINTQSDNLGAFFSLFLKKLNLTKNNASNVIYFAPSLEFIWRRTNINMKFLNPRVSNITELDENEPTLELNYYQNFSYNTYEFNLAPIGFWLLHENEKVSVRLNMNVGYIGRYLSNNRYSTFSVSSSNSINSFKTISDVFYTGKLWITESLTGITLQAEINNTLKSKSPFYGVTLSKAFDLEKLGSFFKPITNR